MSNFIDDGGFVMDTTKRRLSIFTVSFILLFLASFIFSGIPAEIIFALFAILWASFLRTFFRSSLWSFVIANLCLFSAFFFLTLGYDWLSEKLSTWSLMMFLLSFILQLVGRKPVAGGTWEG